MSKKKKARNKVKDQSFNISPGQGIFYSQRKCEVCGKLIWGSSEKNRREAERDLGQRLKAHQQECQKDKQLNLSIPGNEQKETKSVSRVTLRGKVKKRKSD